MKKLLIQTAFACAIFLVTGPAKAVLIFEDQFQVDPALNDWLKFASDPTSTVIVDFSVGSQDVAVFAISSPQVNEVSFALERVIDTEGFTDVFVEVGVFRSESSYEASDSFSVAISADVFQFDGPTINTWNVIDDAASTMFGFAGVDDGLMSLTLGAVLSRGIDSAELFSQEDLFIDFVRVTGEVFTGEDPGPEQPPTTVTEPSTLGLLGVGLFGFIYLRRRGAIETVPRAIRFSPFL